MRAAIKNGLAKAANSKIFMPIFRKMRTVHNKLGAFCDYVERQHETGVSEDLKTHVLSRTFPDLTVKNGAFKGLKYPGAAATGSALLPKLLGSYENEIDGFMQTIAARRYTDIVDVGCAEGYYAVGLARLFPDAKVWAYDVDGGAREMCRLMAEANGVADRLELGGWCDGGTLAGLPSESRALIFADCEGYEKTLFSADIASALANHDVLVECHDYKDTEITSSIRAALGATHDIEDAASVPDFRKAADAAFDELEGYDYEVRKFIVAESRSAPQNWLFLSSRAQTGAG
ncbi:MAG: class I SAM-dependent methyltransferase [Pseudomonadota bacterium]